MPDDETPRAEDLAVTRQTVTPKELSELELAVRNTYAKPLSFVPLDEVARRTPGYTTAQRNLLTPHPGTLIWNSEEKLLQVWEGGKWLNIVTDA